MFSVGLATLKEWEWECVGNHLVGRLQKRFIDSTNGCLRKRGLNVGQAGRMVYDMNEWWEFVRGNAWDIVREMNP